MTRTESSKFENSGQAVRRWGLAICLMALVVGGLVLLARVVDGGAQGAWEESPTGAIVGTVPDSAAADHPRARLVRDRNGVQQAGGSAPPVQVDGRLCQATTGGPGCQFLHGVDCGPGCPDCEQGWNAARPIPWEVFAQGEYVGPSRTRHVPEYYLRVDDVLEFVFRLTGRPTLKPYRLNVGDIIVVKSLTAEEVESELIVQPDGTITLTLLGQVPAADRTLDQLREDLDERYKVHIRDPRITVTPTKLNTTLEELRATIDSRAGEGGQGRRARVTPAGTIQLPAIGSVHAQGLTLAELQREIDHRYAQIVHGLGVTPILVERAPRFIYVAGEVVDPGRFDLTGPTTAMQAISLAGGWNIGGNLREIVVFRRAENWRLVATRLDLRGALLGKRPCPADEIWLRDSDLVVVPKGPILLVDDFIELVFTRGVYGVVPDPFFSDLLQLTLTEL